MSAHYGLTNEILRNIFVIGPLDMTVMGLIEEGCCFKRCNSCSNNKVLPECATFALMISEPCSQAFGGVAHIGQSTPWLGPKLDDGTEHMVSWVELYALVMF